MKPGRQFDMLVADRVMGFHIYQFGGPYAGKFFCGPPNGNGNDDFTLLPHYSTNISASFEVVTKVCEVDKHSRDFMLKREAIPGRPLDWQYFAWFRKDDADDGVEYSAFSESAAHAICLAALKVVNALEKK